MATEKSTILTFHRNEFPGLEKVSPEMVRRLVTVMTSRIREYTKSQGQREKLLSLGKLSAGLAHELNNPASAITRTSAELRKSLAKIPKKVQKLAVHQLSPEQLDKVTALIKEKSLQTPPKLSSLQRSELEDELLGWMDDKEIEDAFCLAEVFVKTGLSVQDMDIIAAQIPASALSDVLDWLGVSLNCDQLLLEIEEASSRISTIVDSVKTYTHMDQASDRQWVELHTGLDSTLTMLNHKLKSKNIEVIRQYQEKLPPVRGIVNELNQLWTNLIDNAIDAMKEGGKLQIVTSKEGSFIIVKIIDNGAGISPEIISKIFDPFFTTKAIGQGTGLGLDIVNRIVMNHSATIKVDSVPGHTQFIISFPLEIE
jgi:signal transduction histidine kinase